MTTFAVIFIVSFLLLLSTLSKSNKEAYAIRYYAVTLVLLSLIAMVAIEWGNIK